jgi:hypothetical protein
MLAFNSGSIVKIILTNIIFVVYFGACSKEQKECTGAEICTEVYVTIRITVKNKSGNSAILDSIRTIIASTGEILPAEFDQNPGFEGVYTLIGDQSLKKISKKGTALQVEGYQNGLLVVDEPYLIGHDCCHLIKKSGKDLIIIE